MTRDPNDTRPICTHDDTSWCGPECRGYSDTYDTSDRELDQRVQYAAIQLALGFLLCLADLHRRKIDPRDALGCVRAFARAVGIVA